MQVEAKYGLPSDVRFCSKCCISNQRPNSCVEFSHTIGSDKSTIHFDADGVCDACRVAERKAETKWDERERELIDLLAQHRSTDGAYDIVVPGSGGKDSYYAAHILKHKYDMHPLLVTWAPSIYTDVGLRNLERWQTIANHILVTPNRAVNRLLTRLSVENLFHVFHCFIVGQKALAPKLAAQYGIRLCMYGESESEYGNPAQWLGAKRSGIFHAPRPVDLCLAGVPVKQLKAEYSLSDSDLSPYLPATPERLAAAQVEVHYLGHYHRWHPQSMYYYAAEHSGFETSNERTPGTYSKYNSLDDKCDDFHYWTTYQMFGIGRATYDAAQEIRSGDITREEGVALVRKFDGEYPERFEREVNEYLSVDGFPPMTRERWHELAEQFRSPHLWDGDKLRYIVQ